MKHLLTSRMKESPRALVPYDDDGFGEDEGDETRGESDSNNDSDTPEEPLVTRPSTRSISHGVKRKDDSDDDEWPTKETQQSALKKFWGKFKVNRKGGHEDDGVVPSDSEPEVPPEFEPEASSDSDSDCYGKSGACQRFPNALVC